MNILILVPQLSGGGAERAAAGLASHLAARHRVYVLCTYPYGNRHGLYPVDPRVEVHELWPEKRSLPRRVLNAVLSLHGRLIRVSYLSRSIAALKRRWQIDLCISFLTYCNLYNVGTQAGEKTVVSVRNMLKPALPKRFLLRMRETYAIRAAGKKADRVVAVSHRAAREQQEVFGVSPARIRTIYNAVDGESVRSAGRLPTGDEEFERMRRDHARLLLAVGRLVPQKGFAHLLRAFAEVRRRFPDAGLVILGTGPEEDALRALAGDLSLAGHCQFAGFRKNPYAYMARTDCYVLSSLREGFSNAMLEAMASGLPVIACDCESGSRELLAPDTDPERQADGVEEAAFGILTPVCSGVPGGAEEPLQPAEAALARALLTMLEDDGRLARYAAKSRTRALDYSPDAIYAKWDELIAELTGA